jgi:hypothetical protein
MKIARILLTAVVMLPAAATANAQMPMYPGMGGPYGGMPAAYFQPTPAPPINGAVPMNPMAPMDPTAGGPAAMPADSFGGAAAPANLGEFYGEGGVPMDAGGGFVGSNPGGRLPFFQRRMFRQRQGRGYFSADAMMWHRNDAFARVINVQTPNRATTPAGSLSANTNVWMRTSDPYFGYETLPRITAGYVMRNDVAVEFSGFYKDDFDAKFDSYGNGNLDATFFGQQPLASNWTAADAQFIEMSTGIHSYEINLAETNRVFNFLTGFRYVEVRDAMLIRTIKNGGSDFASIGTYNHLFGMHTGVRTHLDWNLFGLDLGVKAGYFVNDGQSQVFISNTGLVGANPGKMGGQNDAMVADTRIALTFRPASYLNFRAGYDCTWIVNTVLAADQIDENPILGQNFTGFPHLNGKGDLFLHGPSFGMEVVW